MIVGANDDRTLGLDYDDSVRQRYIQEHHITYPIVNWTKESDHAYGGISIFPTLFLVDRKGVVRDHWIGYVQLETSAEGHHRSLERELTHALINSCASALRSSG